MVPRRIYPYGEYASQIVGYLGEINADETRMLRHLGYRPGDRVGKSGIEKWYETSINGKPGAREILIDAPGHILYQKKILPAGKGAGLALSIDMRLQRVAVDAFRNRNASGAAVFMDSRTGEIIALASWPSFSPAPGPDGLTPANWSSLASDPAHPLLNRAVAGGLPPGSVFKLVVAAAALEEKAAAPASTFFCPGYYMLPGRESYPPKCNAVHGRIGFIDGIAQSCDVVFYTLGQKLGVTNIDKYAKLFGLGSKTGIDCPGESVGLLPDEYWKQHFGSGGRWTPGDTINLSIGQGDMQVTPIQIARMVNVFATRGLLVSPHIARNGEWPAVKLPLYAETIRTVRAGMRGAVQRGTCRGMADFPVAVAAKTGTAQTGTRADPKKAHAWFAGFAPFDNPTVTFAIYVEHGGFGAEAALPIAREILQKALDLGYLK
jgi:penicillin-binding protein 2